MLNWFLHRARGPSNEYIRPASEFTRAMPSLALPCGACRSVTAQVLAAAALAAWLYLLLGRGGFWRCTERDTGARQSLPKPPAVAVIVPARDEVEHIGSSIVSLLRQDYAGPWTVILVDDHSSDGTARI